MYSHLLNLLCTSFICCSIVKFQSAHPFCVSLSIISLLSHFVNRFLKSFSNFFDSPSSDIFRRHFAATLLFYHFHLHLSIAFFNFFSFWWFFENIQNHIPFFVHVRQFSFLNLGYCAFFRPLYWSIHTCINHIHTVTLNKKRSSTCLQYFSEQCSYTPF